MGIFLTASLKEKLWHTMRSDLATYIPDVGRTDLLMCCCCGRYLPQKSFSLEHIIPKQAVKGDPIEVRENPTTPLNVRSGNLLLCQAPLRYKNSLLHPLGCNSWKGRFYDDALRRLLTEQPQQIARPSTLLVIAALSLAYLAAVSRFGYRVVLMQSGRLLREQFFTPNKFVTNMPSMSQILLCGSVKGIPADSDIWRNPFSFTVERDICLVSARSFAVNLPLSRDPQQPIARHLPFAPSSYKLRPDFQAFFD